MRVCSLLHGGARRLPALDRRQCPAGLRHRAGAALVRPAASADSRGRAAARGLPGRRLDRLSRLHVPRRHGARCRRPRAGDRYSEEGARDGAAGAQSGARARLHAGGRASQRGAQGLRADPGARSRIRGRPCSDWRGSRAARTASTRRARSIERLLAVNPEGPRGAERHGLAGARQPQSRGSDAPASSTC